MPLVYDDEPGSWGRASVNWPSVTYNTEEILNKARAWCVHNLTHGCYVTVGTTLRVETLELLTLLTDAQNAGWPTPKQFTVTLDKKFYVTYPGRDALSVLRRVNHELGSKACEFAIKVTEVPPC